MSQNHDEFATGRDFESDLILPSDGIVEEDTDAGTPPEPAPASRVIELLEAILSQLYGLERAIDRLGRL
jgi:hypothetical protein